MATTCAPCVFGAVSTSLLSYPIAIGTVDVQIIPIVTIAANGSASTTFSTTTLATATAAGGAPTTTITFTDSNAITWTTLGTTLTYPTTYVDYIAFAGAAVTGTGCAESLSPSSLTLPAGAPSASLIYPLTGGSLPAGLISYLDGAGGFPAQLNGDQLPSCAALPGALPVSGPSSIVTLVTGLTTSPTTVVSNIPPPTTYTSQVTTPFTSLETVGATQTTGVVYNTVTGGPILASGSVTTSIASAALESLGSSSKSSGSSTKSSATIPLASILSILSRLTSTSSSTAHSTQTGIFTNSTAPVSTARGTIAPTTTLPSASVSVKTSGGPALYSGAAVRQSSSTSNSIIADLFGFVAFMLFL